MAIYAFRTESYLVSDKKENILFEKSQQPSS